MLNVSSTEINGKELTTSEVAQKLLIVAHFCVISIYTNYGRLAQGFLTLPAWCLAPVFMADDISIRVSQNLQFERVLWADLSL